MFPISDSAKSSRFPIVTILLIAANIYAFYLELTALDTDAFIFSYALVPANINFTDFSTLVPFVTSMFLHGGFLHILSNMWFLWIFGDNIEGYFGHIKYLLFYLAAGVIGGFAQYILNPVSDIPMLGASGAVSGVLGAYYALFPHSKVKTVLVIFLFISVVEIPAVIYLFYWFFLQLFSGIASLSTASQSTGGVAFWAHIAGFVTGLFSARALRQNSDRRYIEGKYWE